MASQPAGLDEAAGRASALSKLRARLLWIGFGLGLLGYLGQRLLSPEWLEHNFSRGLFPRMRSLLGAVSGWLPFSLAELLLALLGLWILWLLGRAAVCFVRGTRGFWSLALAGGRRALGVLGWSYALYLVSWGYNHGRLPYAEISGLEASVGPAGSEELGQLLEHLVGECNRLRPLVGNEELELRGAKGQADPRLLAGFENLGQVLGGLGAGRTVFRKPLSSGLLSRLGIVGIYSPFTAEAHLNAQVPLWDQPFAACHEVAHQRGFAREDEANFIAWQVCVASGDQAFAYSGSYAAMNYVSQALMRVDPTLARELLGRLAPSVVLDRERSRDFWRSKHSALTELSHSSNKTYLKTQGHVHGLASYGRMVDLMLAEWRQQRAGAGERGAGPGESGDSGKPTDGETASSSLPAAGESE